jgi:hypothetical protein
VSIDFQTGDRDSVYVFFADDIEYTTPHRTLSGLHEVREKLRWGGEKDNLDVEFEDGEWQDLGDGHVVRLFPPRQLGDLRRARPRLAEIVGAKEE